MHGTTHSYLWYDSFKCVTWLMHMCVNMTHSYARHDTFVLRDMTRTSHSYVWPDLFVCATQLIHMCDMTHSYVWHSFICVTWLIPDLFVCATQPIHMCVNMTHSHDSFVCMARRIRRGGLHPPYIASAVLLLSLSLSLPFSLFLSFSCSLSFPLAQHLFCALSLALPRSLSLTLVLTLSFLDV